MIHEEARGKLLTGWSAIMIPLMLAGAVVFVIRFILGLGATTNLSDAYPWGLWIVIDLLWIALAAGAFVTAGTVYIFGGEKYHGIARSAVLMGLLSYTCVGITLLADLGAPWNFWNLLLWHPEHSAMFEVSWCVGLYVCVLFFEFLPAVFDRFGWEQLRDGWRKISPILVVLAVTWFTFLMSHLSIMWTVIAFVVFSILAIVLKPKPNDKSGVPIMLIIAAVVFSTMHQSSLGSLFLLMPDKLSHLWWTPILPICFFLSAVTGGFATMIFTEMTLSKFFRRPMNGDVLAGLGKLACGAMWVYMIVRIVDLVVRGQLGAAFTGGVGNLLLIEIIAGGLLPAVLLLAPGIRKNLGGLMFASLLIMGGVVLNRLNVVLLGVDPFAPTPGATPYAYYPTLIEILISVSLIGATFFFFGLFARVLPIFTQPHQEA
ncbi:MAG: polysulfide reductase NrfD [Phycisphaerales bacterium]|nr:polysulfide reductase NrfD [Phycisphaerales bacterium]